MINKHPELYTIYKAPCGKTITRRETTKKAKRQCPLILKKAK